MVDDSFPAYGGTGLALGAAEGIAEEVVYMDNGRR